jgi:hypothetical protein
MTSRYRSTVRIAALERFPDPSRRCEPGELGPGGDHGSVWELRPRNVGAAARGWLRLPIALREKLRLFRACLGTGGARRGALTQAPELLERIRAGEIDRVACFSPKDFGLVRYLERELGVPCDAVLTRRTRYFGEFAFELLAVIPYAYWLHVNGLLEGTASTRDTQSLYYFSAHHEERPLRRHYVPITEYPAGEAGLLYYDRYAFPESLDTRRWLPPPYREVYGSDRFRWAREPCIVCNKASDETYLRDGFTVNAMDTELLLAVIGRLRSRYQVVYNRPRSADIVNDHQEIREPGDIEAVKRAFPDVLTIQELRAEHPGLSYNRLQLELFAASERFVSVLGGSSYLASYFGGTNVVYARRGWEVACGAYDNWFHRFSGAQVVPASNPRELLGAVERELLSPTSASPASARS